MIHEIISLFSRGRGCYGVGRDHRTGHACPTYGAAPGLTVAVALGMALGCASSPPPPPLEDTAVVAPTLPAGPSALPRLPAAPPDLMDDEVGERTRGARGLYFHGPYLELFGAEGVIRATRSARANAAVIDLKDGQGRVTYPTEVAILQGQRHAFIDDPAALVDALHEAGLYAIGRVVCFSDPILPHRFPERAITDGRPRRVGNVWQSWGTGGSWLDPTLDENHELVVELAKEAASFGFDEVQLDYVRFPVDPGTAHAVFADLRGRSRVDVLMDLLRRVDAAIHVPLGADVFGLTAFREGDPSGLGQDLEVWTEHVDVFSPMLYLNAMKTWGHHLDRRAFTLILSGVSTLRQRLGPGPVIRPFLQAFNNGVPDFGPQHVREQLRGAHHGGADGYLFWHPASNFGTVFAAASRPSDRRLLREFGSRRDDPRPAAFHRP